MQINFYYDIASPLSYLASTRISALCERANVKARWLPVTWPQPSEPLPQGKANYLHKDLLRMAEFYGITMRLPENVDAPCEAAMRLCLTVDGAERIALSRALFEARFVQGRDIDDQASLAAICKEQALDPALVKRAVGSDALRQALLTSPRQAADDGVFELPAAVIIDEGHKTLFWGVDRTRLLGRVLNLRDDIVVRSRFVDKRAPEMVSFYYDFVSPYSYIAATQIEALATRQGAHVAWKPIFLGGLFKNLGTNTRPMLESYTPPKARYIMRDMGDWADFYNIPWKFPREFPVNSLMALRLAMAIDEAHLPAYSLAMFRAYWRQGRDISDPSVVRDVARHVGISGAAIERACNKDPELKQALVHATDAAQALGIFGAPAMVVRETLFWGQDRLPMVERTLAGWNPRAA